MDSWIKDALPDAITYAASLVGRRDQGEDVVQDCVCRLLHHRDRYHLERDGRKLLFRAIHNACINLKTRRRPRASLDAQGRYETQGILGVMPAATPSPLESAMTEELRQAILEGLQRLKLPYRSVLELASLGHAPAEIAEILELDPKYVRVRLSRARKVMAAWLNARYVRNLT